MLFAAARTGYAALFALKPGPIDRPLFLLSADFDRDGYADLAIADFEAGVVQILINQQDGTFAPHVDSPVVAGGATFSNPTGGPVHMAVGDLNPEDVDSDGVPNSSDNCPNLYNPADSAGKQTDTGGIGVGDVCRDPLQNCAGGGCPNDCDCDGVPDFDSNTKKLDNCPRAYNPTQAPLTAAGADGVCGTPDDERALYGPDGQCGTSDDLTDPSVGSACAASPDLVIVDTSLGPGFLDGIIRVRVNDGTGQLITRTPYASGIGPSQIVLDDFNGPTGKGDGHLDLVVSNSGSNTLQLQSGQAGGLFSPAQTLGTGRGPEGLASGDFNGDGRRDLAVANRTAETIGLYLNAGQNLAASPQATLSLPGSAPTDLLSGRVDLSAPGVPDPLDDLVVLDQGTSATGAIEVFFGSAANTLTAGPSIPLPAGSRPRGGVLRDLDNDGILDLVVDDFTGGQVFIYQGTGNRTVPFTLVNTLTGLTNPAAVTALNIDSNGGPAPDLAVLDFANNRVYLFHNDGGLSFSPATGSPIVSAWNGSSAMSFFGADGLGSDDLVLLHRSPPRIDVLSGIGNGFFRPTFPIPLQGPQSADAMTLSDIRQDNFSDLLVLDQTGNQITVVTGDASGTMVERQSYAVPAGAASATYGSLLTSTNDYDGDSVPDVLDDCPTIYNPPGYMVCKPGDLGCEVNIFGDFCADPNQMPTDCLKVDVVTGQCDSDQNGIGDQCQLLGPPSSLSTACPALDTDGDLVSDYSPGALGNHDIDGDGVLDAIDNCPNVANPRNASGRQPDANNNGVGDACETPPANCIGTSDCDADGVLDFDPNFATKLSPFCKLNVTDPACHDEVMVAALDNCPTVYNPGQEDNNGDHVGNACIVHAALDNCPLVSNRSQADCGLKDCTVTNGPAAGHPGNGIGDACDAPPNDVVVVTPTSAALTILEGDGAGHLGPAPYSPVNARLNNPSSALVGSFSLECTGGGTGICTAKAANDILVAERGFVPNSSDDDLKVLAGNGTGAFPVAGTAPARGDPSALMNIQAQSICANQYPSSTPNGGLRFDLAGRSNIVVALEPGPPSTLGVYLVSSTGLVPPIANPTPLPVPGTLLDAAFNDFNRDGIQDLVALSTTPGPPPVSYVTVFIGMGNGLFYTDPTLNPPPVEGDAAFIRAGVAHLQSSLYPDVMLFKRDDGAPIVLTNVLTGRVDIDGSGRVDGFDLAILARAFGSKRGLDFVLQSDATLQQTGTGINSVVFGSGTETAGQNVTAPSPTCLSDTTSEFQAVSGAYGIPVDINLDGQVDGTDLALLAIQFGSRP